MFLKKKIFCLIILIAINNYHAKAMEEMQAPVSFQELPAEMLFDIAVNLAPINEMSPGENLECFEDILALAESSKQFHEPLKSFIVEMIKTNLEYYTPIRTYKKENLLQLAINDKQWTIAHLFILAGFSFDELKDDQAQIFFAWVISNGYNKLETKLQNIVSKKINFPANQIKSNKTAIIKANALFAAICSNSIDAFEGMLDPELLQVSTHDGLNLLHFASMYGRTNIVKALLSKKDDKQWVIFTGNHNLINAMNTKTGKTALIYATQAGQEETCQILLQHSGRCISQRDFKEKTPFIYAVKNGHKNIVHLFLERQPTYLHDAIGYNLPSIKLIKRLIKMSVNINTVDRNGNTLLQLASIKSIYRNHPSESKRFYKLLKLLIVHAENINHQNNQGDTALILFVRNNMPTVRANQPNLSEKIISLLIDQGANIHLINKKRQTASDCAEELGKTKFVKMLMHAKNKRKLRR